MDADPSSTSLTRAERRRLREIERNLASTDPKLAATFVAESGRSWRRPVPAAAAVVGLLILCVGIVGGWPLLGVVGFALAAVAISLAPGSDRWTARCDRLRRLMGHNHPTVPGGGGRGRDRRTPG